MIVAMGPLTAGADDHQSDSGVASGDGLGANPTPPTPPSVVVEVVPNYVAADGSPLPASDLASTAGITADPAADFNADGAINSQDFFDFLNVFFTGCS